MAIVIQTMANDLYYGGIKLLNKIGFVGNLNKLELLVITVYVLVFFVIHFLSIAS